ncbi:hypothetical protein [Hyphococcus sp.]|uniref:hypothetical protein n=1 Tax=Hyphococcus sp. TaxID=2038636 RepID=UPI003CCB920A
MNRYEYKNWTQRALLEMQNMNALRRRISPALEIEAALNADLRAIAVAQEAAARTLQTVSAGSGARRRLANAAPCRQAGRGGFC